MPTFARLPGTDVTECPDRAGSRLSSKMGDMTELAPSLVELARRFGIATEYEDWTGRRVLVPEDDAGGGARPLSVLRRAPNGSGTSP